MSPTLKNILRLAGFGLILFGIAADIPPMWSIVSVGAGFAGILAGGGGG
ncbi:MAG: hypothetical protein ACOY46_00135 [Bacillota bacterium]